MHSRTRLRASNPAGSSPQNHRVGTTATAPMGSDSRSPTTRWLDYLKAIALLLIVANHVVEEAFDYPTIANPQLERRLESHDVEVINFGVTGYGPNQYAELVSQYASRIIPM